jgi:hypothetical protein
VKRAFLALAVSGLALLTPRAASAHHGWDGYLDAEFAIAGTVTVPVSLAGPHATLSIKGTDGHIWSLVLAPPPMMAQAGLRDGMIPVGARVTAHGHRHKDSSRYEVKTERLVWDGKTFNIYPGRT